MNPTSIEDMPPRSEQSGSTAQSTAPRKTRMKSVQGNVSIKSGPTNAGLIEGSNHILLGRGRGSSQRPGNQRMHRIINKYRGQYIGNSPVIKRRLVRKVYDEIVEGGVMFLKRGGNGSDWVQVEPDVAIQKVASSLRCRKGLIIFNNQADIQESPANQMVDDSPRTLNNNIPPADSMNFRPAETFQEITAHQETINPIVPPAGTAQLELEVLRRTIAQQPQSALLDQDHSLRALLIRQLEAERLQTLALIHSLPFIRPTVSSLPELNSLQAIEQEQKLRRIMESRGNMLQFPPPGL